MRALLVFLLWAGVAQAQSACICLTCALTGKRIFLNVSSHMHPNLLQGDCVTMRLDTGLPPAGTVVQFLAEDGFHYIFRMVAGPGDTVQMVGGALILNGVSVETQRAPDFIETSGPREGILGYVRCPGVVAVGETCRVPRRIETLPNGARYQVMDLGPSMLDDTQPMTVPEGHIFVLGDNRDNSNDSRVPTSQGGRGMIPISSIVAVLD